MKIQFDDLVLTSNLNFTKENETYDNFFMIKLVNSETFFLKNLENKYLSLGDGLIVKLHRTKNSIPFKHNLETNNLEVKIGKEIFKLVTNEYYLSLVPINSYNLHVLKIEYNFLDRELIGYGGFNIIYGNPRIVCEDEYIVPSNEISKLFLDPQQDSPYDAINILYIFKDNLRLANEYMFLPKKICKLNSTNINFGPVKHHVIYDMGLDCINIVEINNQFSLISNYYAIFMPYRNILEGINYIHEKNYIHADIKSDNIAIDQNTGQYKLIDLNLMEINTECIFNKNGLKSPIIIDLINFFGSNELTKFNIKNVRTTEYKKSLLKYLKRILIPKGKVQKYIIHELELEEENIYNRIFNCFKAKKSINISIKDLYRKFDITSFALMLLEYMSCIKNIDIKIYDKIFPFIKLCITLLTCPTPIQLLQEYDIFLSKI